MNPLNERGGSADCVLRLSMKFSISLLALLPVASGFVTQPTLVTRKPTLVTRQHSAAPKTLMVALPSGSDLTPVDPPKETNSRLKKVRRSQLTLGRVSAPD